MAWLLLYFGIDVIWPALVHKINLFIIIIIFFFENEINLFIDCIPIITFQLFVNTSIFFFFYQSHDYLKNLSHTWHWKNHLLWFEGLKQPFRSFTSSHILAFSSFTWNHAPKLEILSGSTTEISEFPIPPHYAALFPFYCHQ